MSNPDFYPPAPLPLLPFGPDSDPTEASEVDEATETAEVDEVTETSEVDESSPTRPATAALSKAAARRVIDKYLELAEATPNQTQMLATALGVRNDLVDITTSIVTSTRNNLTAINELLAIAETAVKNPFEAVIAAFGLSRDSAKRVWSLMQQLGKVSGTLPAKEATAATKIAEAAALLTAADREGLGAVRQLGRK